MEYKNSAKREKGKHPKEVSANYDSESNLLTIPNFVKRQKPISVACKKKWLVWNRKEKKYEEWAYMERKLQSWKAGIKLYLCEIIQDFKESKQIKLTFIWGGKCQNCYCRILE